MNILLYIGIAIIVVGYLYFVYIYLFNRNKIKKDNSIDVVIKSFDNNKINIIKASGKLFSTYNVERDIIKLTDNTYDKNDIFSLAVCCLLSGYYIKKNMFLKIIGKIVREIRVISFSPIIVIILAIVCRTGMDFKIGIVLLAIMLIIQYFFDSLNMDIAESTKIKDKDVLHVLKSLVNVYKMFFIGTLIILVRFIVMLF